MDDPYIICSKAGLFQKLMIFNKLCFIRINWLKMSIIEINLVLLHKIEGQISRVNGIHLLSTEEGVLTISDDRSLRVYLKRDNEQFWPSIYHYLPFSPSSMHFDEYKLRYHLASLITICNIFCSESKERKDRKGKI